MIRFLGKEQIPQLCRFCSGDPFGCRIASLALAYGADSGFAEFWLQTTESGQACGAVSRLNGAVTVQISSAADQEELANGCCMDRIWINRSFGITCGITSPAR